MAEEPALTFAGLLRQLRAEAGLTQEELAEAAGLSPRSVSDLERGINRTARKDTAGLLADALGLTGPVRGVVRGGRPRAGPGGRMCWRPGSGRPGAFAAAATRTLPRDVAASPAARPSCALVGWLDGRPRRRGGGDLRDRRDGRGRQDRARGARRAPAGRQFPDGQFFLPLHGHTPGQRPVDPADALASLLLTAGVAAQQIPPGLEARAALWRDYLAGKKILLLLDDAAGHDQVRPLLPGTAGSLVLITSRRRLTALEDAAVISLDTLPPAKRRSCWPGSPAGPGCAPPIPAVGEITRLCGYLPLAIGMLARQLRHHPARTAWSWPPTSPRPATGWP